MYNTKDIIMKIIKKTRISMGISIGIDSEFG